MISGRRRRGEGLFQRACAGQCGARGDTTREKQVRGVPRADLFRSTHLSGEWELRGRRLRAPGGSRARGFGRPLISSDPVLRGGIRGEPGVTKGFIQGSAGCVAYLNSID